MKAKMSDHAKDRSRQEGNVRIRKDLQDPSKGKDLSYLNEMPQMAGYEGVVAGVPPPKEEDEERRNDKADNRRK